MNDEVYFASALAKATADETLGVTLGDAQGDKRHPTDRSAVWKKCGIFLESLWVGSYCFWLWT